MVADPQSASLQGVSMCKHPLSASPSPLAHSRGISGDTGSTVLCT